MTILGLILRFGESLYKPFLADGLNMLKTVLKDTNLDSFDVNNIEIGEVTNIHITYVYHLCIHAHFHICNLCILNDVRIRFIIASKLRCVALR